MGLFLKGKSGLDGDDPRSDEINMDFDKKYVLCDWAMKAVHVDEENTSHCV